MPNVVIFDTNQQIARVSITVHETMFIDHSREDIYQVFAD